MRGSYESTRLQGTGVPRRLARRVRRVCALPVAGGASACSQVARLAWGYARRAAWMRRMPDADRIIESGRPHRPPGLRLGRGRTAAMLAALALGWCAAGAARRAPERGVVAATQPATAVATITN